MQKLLTRGDEIVNEHVWFKDISLSGTKDMGGRSVVSALP